MSDLEELIASADREYQQKAKKRHLNTKSSGPGFFERVSKLSWVPAAAILMIALVSIVLPIMPISEDTVRTDLNALLDAAQASIETYRDANGSLPDRIPSSALVGMVGYDPVGDSYRLTVSMNGVSLSREQ